MTAQLFATPPSRCRFDEKIRRPTADSNLMLPTPVLKIRFGPPNADFWSVWSSQKARKFRQIQPTTKVRILCFEWKRICFQTRDVLCSYNMNYEE